MRARAELRRAHGVGLLLAALCLACEPAPEVTALPLGLRQLAACPLGAPPENLELTALGDFPSQSLRIAPAGVSRAFESLPLETRELALLASAGSHTGFGRHALKLDMREEQLVWLLPPELSCPLADDLVRVVNGATAVALPGADVLIVGGTLTETLASSEALLLRGGTETAEPVAAGMLLRRAHASATLSGDRAIIAGGTADARGTAHDTYEIYDVASQRFVAALSGKLARPRMRHAALALPDGRLLLAGGAGEAGGEPLASAELVDVRGAHSELLENARGPRVPRREPTLLALDSGSVWLLAGRDAEGRVLGSVERFERRTPEFTLLAQDLTVRAEVAVAALPGARVAWLGCDHGPAASCELTLLFETPAGLRRLPVELPFAELAPAGLRDLRLAALDAGRLLLTAADDSDPNARRRAFVIDPAAARLTRIDASRVPSQLLALETGAVLELDANGASLRAATSLGRYASPALDVVSGALDFVALDAPGHWLREADGLRALTDAARLDLAELRFSGLRLELVLEGALEVVLYDGQSEQPSVRFASGELELGPCTAQLPSGAALRVERAGTQLRAGSADASPACSAKITAGPLGVGLRLARGALLRQLTLERR